MQGCGARGAEMAVGDGLDLEEGLDRGLEVGCREGGGWIQLPLLEI